MKAPKRNKLTYGIGLNDANYTTQPSLNGKRGICPFYTTWSNMLKRGYCKKFKETDTTYINASVCKEWHTFSTFKSWMKKQNWRGNDLDKDIIKPGNKHYCPEFCCFVPQNINKIININPTTRGKWPMGVYKDGKRFKAYISLFGKQTHIGRYATPEEAFKAYLKVKIKYVHRFADQQVDSRIANGLRKHVALIKNMVPTNA